MDMKVSLNQIKRDLKDVNDTIAKLKADFERNIIEARQIEGSQEVIQRALEAQERLAGRLREIILIRSGISKGLLDLQSRIIILRKEVERTDITVAEHNKLRAEMNLALERLRQGCDHKFVLQTRDSYAGSYSYDYDDAHCGYRLCMVCGFGELSDGTSKDNTYKTLGESPERVAKRDLRKNKAETLIPFVEAQELFLKFAGGMNVTD